MKRFLAAAADILLPRSCVVCGRSLLLSEEHICLECLSDMPLTRYWERKHNEMADRFNAQICKNSQPEPGQPYEAYCQAAALFFFSSDGPYRNIPYKIKYEGYIQSGRFFGGMLGRYLASSPAYSDLDIVIPVPLHWTRKWSRGYNQAEVIAMAVAEELGVPMRADIIFRRRRTKTQTKVEVTDKQGNVDGAFGVCGDVRSSFAGLAGLHHMLIVDDVFTTGATLHACFVALRSVFPPSVRISVVTLAFVGRV